MRSLPVIGSQLAQDYHSGNYTRLLETEQIEFNVDGLMVRCKDSPISVLAVVRKFKRPLRAWQKPQVTMGVLRNQT